MLYNSGNEVHRILLTTKLNADLIEREKAKKKNIYT